MTQGEDAPRQESPSSPSPHASDAHASPTLIERVGLTPPRRGPDPYAHRRGEPRTFAALWVLFLFGGVAVTLGSLGVVGLVSADVYRPALRTLVVIIGVGVGVVWPLVRLSQEAPEQPGRAALADWALVMLPVHGLLWPQGLRWMAAWPWEVCLAATTLVSLSGLAIAGVLAWATTRVPEADGAGEGVRWREPAPRWSVMAALLLVCVAPGALAVRGEVDRARPGEGGSPGRGWEADAALLASPSLGVLQVTHDRSDEGTPARATRTHAYACAAWGGLAAAAWAGAGARARRARRGAGPSRG